MTVLLIQKKRSDLKKSYDFWVTLNVFMPDFEEFANCLLELFGSCIVWGDD